MFDAEYFMTHVYTQIEELGFATVKVSVDDGTEYRIQGFRGAYSGYVLFAIYPPEGQGAEHLAKRKMSGLPFEKVVYDQVAIPYERITGVYMTIKEPEAEREPFDMAGHVTMNFNHSAVQIGSQSAVQQTEFGSHALPR